MIDSQHQRHCPSCGETFQSLFGECPNCGAVFELVAGEKAVVSAAVVPIPRELKKFHLRKAAQKRILYRSMEQSLAQMQDFLRREQFIGALELLHKTDLPKRMGSQYQVLGLALQVIRESFQALSKKVEPPTTPTRRPVQSHNGRFFLVLLPLIILALIGVRSLFSTGEILTKESGIPDGATVLPTVTVKLPSYTQTAAPTPTTLLPQTLAISRQNLDQIKELFFWSAGDDIISLTFSPDKKFLASGDAQGTVKVWAAWQTTPVFEFPGTHVAFSPNGEWIGVAGPTGLSLYRTSDGSLVRSIDQKHSYYSILFSPDSQIVLAGSDNTKFYVWNTNDGSEQKPGGGFVSPVHTLSFSLDGRLLAVASNDLTYVWSLQEQKIKRGIPISKQQPIYFSAALDSDGEWYATGQKDGQIYIWRVSNGERMSVFNDKGRFVYGLQFLHGSNPVEVLVSGDEVNLSFWIMDRYKLSLSRSIYVSAPIRSLAIATENKMIATGGQDGVIHLWGVMP